MTIYVLDGWGSWLDLLEHHARQQSVPFGNWQDIIDAIEEIRYAPAYDVDEAEMWAEETLTEILERYA